MKFLISLVLLLNFVYAQTNIIVSVLPQQTFVEKIGGDKVKVTTMVRPGSDPHSYEPKPSQMQDLSNAKIYFPIGVEFENAWLDKFASQNKNMKFIDTIKGISLLEMKNDEHAHEHAGGKDPHVWTSPSNVKIIAKNIYDTLVEFDPDSKEYFKSNYTKFITEIDQTDKKIKDILSVLPKNSVFMVFHPSWGHFAKEYNLVQLTVEVEGKEPKPRMLQKIINEAKEENVKAIFAQLEFSDKSAKVIASELNIKVIKVTPLAANWSENLIQMADAIANNRP